MRIVSPRTAGGARATRRSSNLASRIAAVRPETPFILTTGYAAEHLGEVGNVPLIVEVLDKPFDRSTFARAVRGALDGEVTCPDA